MADGGRQAGFNFPRKQLVSALRPGEIVVDFFAGGGGASEALRQALGRDPDVAVNHDHQAIGMHAANHPFTRHMEADVWTVDILREVAGRPVGWFHASPDCTHFSQAKGGQPRDRATRSLSWVVLKVAGTLERHGLAPRIISLENVKQILQWCPLVAKRDKATGRVVTLDGTVAAPGERVPLREQFLVPDKRRLGDTWRKFVAALRALGYVVEWRLLKACDYGAGTSRERLFLIARRDGAPIRWPEPTHGPGRAKPYVTAADCIDWSIRGNSIFDRPRPLAEATLRRIARGIKRYVLDAAEPFIVGVGGRMGQTMERPVSEPAQTITTRADSCICVPTLVQCANASASGIADAGQPLGTVTAWPKGGSHAVVAAHLHAMAQNVPAVDPLEPLPTILAGATRFGVVAAHLEQANGGFAADQPGHDARKPMSTITAAGSQQRLVTANLAKLRGTSAAADATEPLAVISAGGEHHAVVECTLSPDQEAGALRVAAFLMRYHGTGGQHAALDAPLTTATTKERLALVTVTIQGTPYVIVDICLRMLRREELFRAQGFPPGYIIDRTADGTKLSNSASVKMCGNSVSPPPLAALARANLEPADVPERMAA